MSKPKSFKKGDRVKLTKEAIANGLGRKSNRNLKGDPLHGTVIEDSVDVFVKVKDGEQGGLHDGCFTLCPTSSG